MSHHWDGSIVSYPPFLSCLWSNTHPPPLSTCEWWLSAKEGRLPIAGNPKTLVWDISLPFCWIHWIVKTKKNFVKLSPTVITESKGSYVTSLHQVSVLLNRTSIELTRTIALLWNLQTPDAIGCQSCKIRGVLFRFIQQVFLLAFLLFYQQPFLIILAFCHHSLFRF